MSESLALLPVSALLLVVSAACGAHEYRTLDLPDGLPLRYALVLPEGFDPARTYPTLLALPPGGQDSAMVEAGLSRYWGEQAARRGWIVVSPVAPTGMSFFSGGEEMLPALIEHVLGSFDVEGGKLHLAGASNGGRSAFRVAGLYPDRFHTVTVLPGFPPAEADVARLPDLRRVPVTMFVGGADEKWIEPMNRAAVTLRAVGADVTLTILPGEGHVPPSLDGDVMMNHLEGRRAMTQVAMTLDAFHAAAAGADGDAYFGLLTPDAIFIGTDPTERWTREEFVAFARPYFDEGQGWTYVAIERHVTVSAHGDTAWFDEMLDNEKYGVCRGTGVLVRGGEGWKIAHYALTMPIPNEIAMDVVGLRASGVEASREEHD